MDVRCPQCQSDNTQAIQMLVAANSQIGKFKGGAASYSQGGGIGGSAFAGTTQNQSVLAARFTLGKLPGSGIGFLISGIILCLFSLPSLASKEIAGCGGAFAALGIGMLLIYFLGKSGREHNLTQWRQHRDYLNKAWVCLRCGKDWIPQ